MKQLFTLAIFFSATLLFMVQPLVAKILLPVLGGSPAVWSTCVLFFQAVLLLGYLYAHALSTRVSPLWQRTIHVLVLIAASVTLLLPAQIGSPGDADPLPWLLGALVRSVGLPFFALSATAPLLQHWFSRTGDPKAKDPYFLYAASNAGSLLGLLGYLLVEPLAARSSQILGWSVGFWAVAALISTCVYRAGYVGNVVRVGKRTGTGTGTGTRNPEPAPSTQNPAPRTYLLWLVLALVPSALLLAVTQHLATDVVSAPFVWVVPLALYLATFIAAFSTRRFGSARWWGSVAPLVAMLVLLISLAVLRFPILPIAVAHLVAFTALAMLCHTRLAESRPDPSRLTEYFVCVSLGGVLGGASVALLAPAVFSWILEYPLAIAAAILLRPQTADADRMAASRAGRWAWRAGAALLFVVGYWGVSAFNESADAAVTQRLGRMSFAIPAILLLLRPGTALLFAGATAGLLVGAGLVRTGGDVLYRERTFFGVHEVTSQQDGNWHVLTHGTTTHGVQAFRGKLQSLPTAYYHPTGPIGDVVFTLSPEGRFRDVGVIGLGAGALAAYAGSGVRMDFFEVDDAVIRIAENPLYFRYLSDARARPGTTVRTRAVDGRLGLQAMPEASYDLIVVDAFSSDAIPTHLLTREAVAMFASRLKPRGVMAFHVSNRFFNLAPVLARIADDRGLVSYTRNDKDVPPERAAEAMRPSVWVVLARNENDLGQLARTAPRWVRASGTGMSLWTDEYTNVLGVLED
jgi:spermidine synthase